MHLFISSSARRLQCCHCHKEALTHWILSAQVWSLLRSRGVGHPSDTGSSLTLKGINLGGREMPRGASRKCAKADRQGWQCLLKPAALDIQSRMQEWEDPRGGGVVSGRAGAGAWLCTFKHRGASRHPRLLVPADVSKPLTWRLPRAGPHGPQGNVLKSGNRHQGMKQSPTLELEESHHLLPRVA